MSDDLDDEYDECFSLGCDEKLVAEEDGYRYYVCAECGAEWDEPMDDTTEQHEDDFLAGATCNPAAPEECEACQ